MISTLDRKLIRDLWNLKSQALAVALVIMCAIAMMVMSLSMIKSLEKTQENFYGRYRFAEVFAQLKRAPNTLESRIREIPGVAEAQVRVVAEVTLDIPGLPEPASGTFTSIPDWPTEGLNGFYLRRGRYIEPGRGDEVLVGEAFALAHRLQPGDSVTAVLKGRMQKLKIVGIVLSPEWVFEARAGEVLPDNKRFGVFWMRYEDLANAFDLYGAFNNVTLTLAPGASKGEVMLKLDRLLEPYGGLGAYDRADHASHRRLSDEIQQLKTVAVVLPTIFLSVSAFLLNVVLTRLVNMQREQIAILKAFGYTSFKIGVHYLKFAILVVAMGAVLGSLAGGWLGVQMVELYTKFFRFPKLEFYLNFQSLLTAVTVSCVAASLGVLAAVRKALKLPPAEAMRPEPPATYRQSVIERTGIQALFSQTARMALRHLERKPLQASLTCFGLALATGILVVGTFMKGALDHIMEFQFARSQRQDVTAALVEPTSFGALAGFRSMPGVIYAEPFRSVQARFRSGHREHRTAIQGLPEGNLLQRVLDENMHEIKMPEEGLVLSEKLADLLEARIGDTLEIEVLEGERPVRNVPVTGLVRDFSGLGVYMNRRALNRLMREGDAISGAFLTIDPARSKEFYEAVKEAPRIASVSITEAVMEGFRKTTAESLLIIRTIYTVFASVIAFGVVYNSARISLSERSRELATLRVIGFTKKEIAAVLLSELAVITLVALPLGLWIGRQLAYLLTKTIDTETVRVPLVINPSSYAFAVTVVTIASVISGWLVARKLSQLDLVAVLKTRE